MNLIQTMILNVLTYVLNKYGIKIFLFLAVLAYLVNDNLELRRENKDLKQQLKTKTIEADKLRKILTPKPKKYKPKKPNNYAISKIFLPFLPTFMQATLWRELAPPSNAIYPGPFPAYTMGILFSE